MRVKRKRQPPEQSDSGGCPAVCKEKSTYGGNAFSDFIARQLQRDKVPLVMAAYRAYFGRLDPFMDIAAVGAHP